ncbi:helicase-associated domain-containing protein [Solwaraspora sp. WMMD791]|uniref:helicase-associated domain-containing protein n=1 Tax=Solwaraspora sp. WMMD791 TaxID=3016086 RepID=UPI00249C4294|nr:helicase-associated domain-containing protein [Solwaraspora sp. WMMD791]WFE25275.1 helicase-associated domain-containing protein [Solwaraspora sp. WMMD791]
MTTTLADHLRSRSDAELGDLLRLRPDLVVPAPTDLATLAARAQSRISTARALDDLDEFTLRILDAARLSRDPSDGVTSVDAVLAMAVAPGGAADADQVRQALDRLLARCLLYGPPTGLRVAGGVDEAGSPYPAGLGRPAAELDDRVARRCADPAQLRRTLLSAAPPARAVLDRLAAGPPLGTVGSGTGGPETGPGQPGPVRWLVDAGLLAVVTDVPAAERGQTVELPREVGLLLRRETGPLGVLRPDPPPVTAPGRPPKTVDAAGSGQAMEFVRHAGDLLEAVATEPVPMLRTGGIGVRELRRLARVGGISEQLAGLVIEVGYAAGLIGEVDAAGSANRAAVDQQLLPTTGYDLWCVRPPARRWEQLAQAWLAMTRRPGLIGGRDDRDRAITARSPAVERAGAPTVRRTVLGVLAGLAPGAAPTADDVLTLLAWQAPRRSRGRDELHREVLDEAAQLGVTALGALTGYGRLLLLAEDPSTGPAGGVDDDPLGVRSTEREHRGEASAVERALAALLPDPVDHFLVQADLTVVVPGPPDPSLAAELEVVAEPESTGAASVHRVTPASVRRALDAGWSAGDLHELFARRSRTPVPQGLTYLVDDTARTHGGLRAGSAGGYLRSDDEALLAEVLADRRLGGLVLRRLAPTVLVSAATAGRLVDALRQAGYAPTVEDGSGAALRRPPRVRRAPAPHPATMRPVDPLAAPPLTGPRIEALVEQLRRGEAAVRAARRTPGPVRAANGQPVDGLAAVQAHAQALAVLQQAVRDKSLVWVGYVDAHGAAASRLVRPVSIGAGFLRAEDERTETLHTFALQRVTAAVVHD